MKPMVAGYLLTGLAVTVLLWQHVSGRARERLEPSVWHLVAWPFFVPALMAALKDPRVPRALEGDPIGEIEDRLLEATGALARQLGQPLRFEAAQIRALASAMRGSASRADALQRVLLQPGFDDAALAGQLDRLRATAGEPLVPVLDARLGHVRRVRALWQQARADLELALARAAELESRLTLLRFEATGPAVVASERARQAAQAIDQLADLIEELRRG
ncbi:MAG TPA: hypothetical protein VGK67_17115 [Myxococcales bacterium]|jgi:hypothetical protein